MKVWLIGESNPYQTPESDPEHHFALYPDPPNSAGGRLCRALKLPDAEYLKRYQRRNLLHTVKWSVPAARRAAATILGAVAERDAVVLLGAKVAAAFGVPFDVLKTHQRLVHGEVLYTLLVVPHPSGLSRLWNQRSMRERVVEAILRLDSVAT